MTLPDVLRTVRWMVRDTFRQSVASRLFWVVLAVTGVATAACLSIDVTGDTRPDRLPFEVPAAVTKPQVYDVGWEWLVRDKVVSGALPPADADPQGLRQKAWDRGMEEVKVAGARVIDGDVRFGFGAVRVPLGRNRDDAVGAIQVWLAGAVGDAAGVVLALLWTAGFLPTFLDPRAATVLLAKPAPRWAILVGKYLGVVLFVALQAALFVGGTWLALGLKTNVWTGAYWLAVPLLAMNFAVFYAVSAFLAVWTRSSVASAFGVLLFWMVCWAMNYTRHQMIAFPPDGFTPAAGGLLELGYWVLPKPFDLGGLFFEAMRAENFAIQPVELIKAREAGRFHPELSVLASGAFAAVTLGLAAYEFEMTDY
jgi:hypothetical protein